MRIAKGNVSDGNAAAVWAARVQLIFRDRDALVGERGTSDGTEVIELYDQSVARGDVVEVGDLAEGTAFALLRTLAIAGMKKCDVGGAVTLARDRRADAESMPPLKSTTALCASLIMLL